MSNPIERLRALIGGEKVEEEDFAASEASAQCTQTVGHSQQAAIQPVPTHPLALGSATTHSSAQTTAQQGLKGYPAMVRPSQHSRFKEADKRHWCNSIRRAQRYLGLRSSTETDTQLIDVNLPAPYPCELDAIIISIDIEADELDNTLITEIGVATLDTRSLAKLTPRAHGINWLNQVKGKHFRTVEGNHIRNHVYIQGDPDAFQACFGKSTTVSSRFVPDHLHDCFNQTDPLAPNKKLRNVVLVGHNPKQDIRWLEGLGFSLLDVSNLIEVIATDDMQKAMKRDSSGTTSLARLLAEVGIQGENLHNAGNDAAYTLQAFVAMALKSLSNERSIVSLDERIAEAVRLAEERAVADWAAWDAAEQNSGNGSEPVPFRFSKLRG